MRREGWRESGRRRGCMKRNRSCSGESKGKEWKRRKRGGKGQRRSLSSLSRNKRN
jgi:hypothetical protein